MSDNTGSIALPAFSRQNEQQYERPEEHACSCETCRYPGHEPKGPMGLSKDTWVRMIIWAVPIVFASGTLFVSMKNVDARIDGNIADIKDVGVRQQKVVVEQSLQAQKLNTIAEEQKEIKADVKVVDEKLDDQKGDLTLIKAKLRVRDE